MSQIQYSEDQLAGFTKNISNSEDDQYISTIKMIEDLLGDMDYIIKKENDMGNPSPKIFQRSNNSEDEVILLVQGSYANDTCVKQDSDVDIAVIHCQPFIAKFVNGFKNTDYGFCDYEGDFNLAGFKKQIFDKLKSRFDGQVIPHKKCIKIYGNTSRKDCDVVPCERYRNYAFLNSSDPNVYASGILIQTDKGQEIINYPEVHYKNEVDKNNKTKGMFKKIVRVFKNIANDFSDNNMLLKTISSFKLECLLYNAPNQEFLYDEPYQKRVVYLCNELIEDLDTNPDQLLESNGIKPLFIEKQEVSDMIDFLTGVKEACHE